MTAMASFLSRVMTAATVLLLGALPLLMVIDLLTEQNLGRWTGSLGWALGVLILIRLLSGARNWRSGVAAPLFDSASVQSRMFGFTPGNPESHHAGGTVDTSHVEDHPSPRPLP